MNVSVERYQRRKYMSQENSPMLYYVRQKWGTVRVMDVEKLADAIEANSSLTAGDVKHAIEAFVEQLRLSLTQGDKVKIDGLGTFSVTARPNREVEDPLKIRAESIKLKGIGFKPSPKLKERLRSIEFTRMK